MSYIHFNPTRLTNLDFTTRREVIRTNHEGSYFSTTINGCNTRKYHGLLICPVDSLGGSKHVLLSALDETVVVKGSVFNLATRRYAGGHTDPKGNKYLAKFDFEKIPCFTYRVGNVILTKERVLVDKEQQLLIKYKVEEAPSSVTLQLRPFLAFRNIHELSKCNLYAQTHYETVPNGISIRMYDGYPHLNLQLSREGEFIAAPDWYYNVEYIKEKNRGYECLEDLYTPGLFEVKLKKGESIIFSASTKTSVTTGLKQRFSWEVSKRISRDSFLGCLKSAASQFIVYKEDSAADIIAGFPWYNSISRQTFISLPGLRHAQTERRLKLEILKTYLPFINKGLIPSSIADNIPVYHSADASLWMIWAMQKFKLRGSRLMEYCEPFYQAVKTILENYRRGTTLVSMLENGLLFAAEPGVALTWMDSYSNGSPCVPRYGMPVELNALWYNAVCFGIEFAKSEQDVDFIEEWKGMPELIAESFLSVFWNDEKGYLADVANSLYTDWSVRPNMVLAASLPYTPLSTDQKEKILNIAVHQLLTPRGLRTLSPDDPNYIGVVEGTSDQRHQAEHNGAAYPWLLLFFTDLYLDINKKGGTGFIKKLILGFEPEMSDFCLGTLSEMYNGSPPHSAKGAVSQAWNVAALLYAYYKVEEWEVRISG